MSKETYINDRKIDQMNDHQKNHHHNEQGDNKQQLPTQQPTIRHIPIFIEGRDEPIINKEPVVTTSSTTPKITTPLIDSPSKSTIFGRQQAPAPPPPQLTRKVPERHLSDEFNKPLHFSHFPSGSSSSDQVDSREKTTTAAATATATTTTTSQSTRNIPITILNDSMKNKDINNLPTKQQHVINLKNNKPEVPAATTAKVVSTPITTTTSTTTSTTKPIDTISEEEHVFSTNPKIDNSIHSIETIQKEVMILLDKVETFSGNRTNKEYIYLDEMLTQNLLKLDTIDTEGNEIVKLARREAIKCINECIAILERKADATHLESLVEQKQQQQPGGASTPRKIITNSNENKNKPIYRASQV